MKASLGLSASYDDLRTDSSASANLQKQDGSYSDISGNYSLSFDSRDRVFMPTSGSILKFGQTLPLFSDSASLVNNFSASKYASLNENVVGVGKFYLSTISAVGSDDVRLSRRKGLSTRRLRGFQKGKIGEFYNIGSNKNLNNLEISKLLIKIAKEKIKIGKNVRIKFVKDRPGHDFRYALSSKKILTTLDWKTKVNLKQGLEKTFLWYLKNYRYYKSISKMDIVKRIGNI